MKDWWLFISCEPGMLDYYQWLSIRYGLNVLKGSRAGPHISVARHERPKNQNFWKQLLGKEIYFQYSNQVRWNDEHVWIDVEPEPINEIRRCLGLQTFRSFHVTVGRFRHAM